MKTFDQTDPAFLDDPYPIYEEMREQGPFRTIGHDGEPVWMLARHDDVAGALRDAATFSSQIDPNMPPVLLNIDDPQHGHLRGLAQRAFGPRVVRNLDGWVADVVVELTDKLFATPGPKDFVAEYAVELPIHVVAALTGTERTDHKALHRYATSLDNAFTSQSGFVAPEQFPTMEADLGDFLVWCTAQVARHAADPGADNLLGQLGQSVADGEVDELAIVVMVGLIITAGHETTKSLLGGGTRRLLLDPDLREQLLADPSLIPKFVEEQVRLESPLQWVVRRTTTDVAVGDVEIPKGERCQLWVAAANRDPRRWEQPEQFSLERASKQHLGFGMGGHYCLGAPLARLEGELAFKALLPLLPRLSLDPARKARRRPFAGSPRGYDYLPIIVDA